AHKVNVRLPANDTGAEIRVLISQNGEPIEERLIPVGATAQIFTVVVPTADPVLVTAQSRNVAYTENGIWTVVPDAVGDSKSTEVDPFADWDDDDDPDKPLPPPPTDAPKPDAPTAQPTASKKNVWQTVNSTNSTGGVTAEQSAEGVDKITNAVGEVLDALETDAEAPEVGDADHTEGKNQVDSAVEAGLEMLPSAPSVLGPSTTSTITFPMGRINGADYSRTLDFSEWETPIAIFRGLCSGCLFIMATIIFTRTIRGAFAG
ncbi:MAG: hypothetical protein ABII82_16950, partial [Verrucomicrobiota bacterium]